MQELQFHTEKEFRDWFEQNYKQFGYTEIILSQHHATPDYVVKTNDGKILKLEIELLAENFLLHKHTTNKVDCILAYSTKKRTLKLDIPITLLKPFIPSIMKGRIKGSKTNWKLFLALVKFPNWKTKDFINKGFHEQSIYKARKHLKDAEIDLDNRLKG